MKRVSIIGAAAIVVSGALLGAQAPNQSTAPPPSTTQGRTSTSGDQAFVVETAMVGMAEVELGKLAADKAASGKVKAFGQQMVADHGKAGDELKALAASKQIRCRPPSTRSIRPPVSAWPSYQERRSIAPTSPTWSPATRKPSRISLQNRKAVRTAT